MLTNKNEQRVILLIRYSLPVLILVATLIIAVFASFEHKKNIEQEKAYIEKQYIQEQKEYIKSDLERVYTFINDKRLDAMENLKKQLKHRIENTYSIIHSIYQYNKNQKSEEDILKEIKNALRYLRFADGKGYFFIYSLDGEVILNPLFPKLEGKNLWNYKDSKGTFILKDMNSILQTNDETFYSWYWKDPKKMEEKEYLKVGFFKKFEPLNIFIGTGYYLDDYIKNLKDELIVYLSKLRYKDDRYIFLIDENAKLAVTKHKSLLNQTIYTKDLIFFNKKPEELKNLKNNEGTYLNYNILLNDEIGVRHKTSYFLKYAEWDWIIGTGFTTESIESVIKKKQNFLTIKYKEYLNKIYLIGLVFLVLLLIISSLIAKYIENSFISYTDSLEKKQKLLIKSQKIALLGDWYLDLNSMEAYWADTILEIFGIKKRPKKLGPDFLKGIMHKDDWKCFEDSLSETIKYNKEHRCIYRIIRPDNTIRWIECRGELDKQKNRIVGIVQDITFRKEAELDKERKEKILYQQSKMAAMGEMIGNIAHQWRQPLSVISTASTGLKLKKEMNILSDKDLIDTMDSINNSTQYLSQTIEDFRNFFSPSTHNISKVKISELFKDTFKLLTPQFNSKGITIIDNIEDISIETLKNELIQALINIFNNSKDALIEIDEKNKYIFVEAYKKENQLIIEIFDNGKGIEDKIISRIFEPYFTTKYKSQGTGIGLYMTQEIINKLLNGEIYVENIIFNYKDKEYTGAKFTIKINLS